LRILILGAGGQGQVVADAILFAAEDNQQYEPIGYLDDDPELWGSSFLGIPVLGPLNSWPDIPHDALILGIGSNRERSEIFASCQKQGAEFAAICHPRALIGHDVIIGPGTYIGAYAIIAAGTVVGSDTIIHGNSVIGHHNTIEDHVHIAPGVNTAGNVTIGTGAMIGISASVIPQRTIGKWATIGAATLVNRDVMPDSTVVGVPCKPIMRNF
jgi:sugar O-acyltransferase (sialic acid O-acetyltransferase NeuD family)